MEPAPSSPAQGPEGRQQLAIYLAAGTSLILLGIVLRSSLLNWIVGPAYVVAFVVLANRWLDRRERARPASGAEDRGAGA